MVHPCLSRCVYRYAVSLAAVCQVHEPSIAAPHRVGASGINSYYDGVLELDWAVGRVLDQLEQLDILDNTVVYFASDYNDLMSFSQWMPCSGCCLHSIVFLHCRSMNV